ncbi:MAG: hypothetical protein GY749_15715 [Desulfobacteraceae bacterium]|nr:hypothetical protein [Desulfobacteraceae bacterium]
MRRTTDIAVYNAVGQLALLTEVRNKLMTSSEWAAKLRRNILEHGSFPETPFFLLALPDRFYLWKNAGIVPEIVNPNYEIDPSPFLNPYYERSGLSLSDLSGQNFMIIISFWLNEIIISDIRPITFPSNQKWLTESGFLKAVTDGRLTFFQ